MGHPETQEGRVTVSENSLQEANGPYRSSHRGAIVVISGDIFGPGVLLASSG